MRFRFLVLSENVRFLIRILSDVFEAFSFACVVRCYEIRCWLLVLLDADAFFISHAVIFDDCMLIDVSFIAIIMK